MKRELNPKYRRKGYGGRRLRQRGTERKMRRRDSKAITKISKN